MKNIKNSIIIALISLFFNTLTAQIKKAEIVATGLTCSMCSNAINKQLKTIKGVEKVDIDLNNNTFEVFLSNNNAVTPKTLKDNIEKAGFFVGSMVITVNLSDQKISDNITVSEKEIKFTFIDSKAKILNGVTKLKVLDQGFVTKKEFKKLSKSYSKYPTYAKATSDNYHVKAI